MKAVMYGAGNIGRGFIGQLLSQSGYHVDFIDVAPQVIEQLNTQNEYPVRILYKDTYEETMVTNVACIDGKDPEAIATAIAEADVMATAIGVNVLKFIIGNIANGLKKRWENPDKAPLNIIICENLIGADAYLKGEIAKLMNDEEKKLLDEKVGFVEASIGRMVPVQTDEMKGDNPLRVCVESFGILPVDKAAFKGEIPAIKNMVPFTPFEFYIERKLFIHNMGHAFTAYLGAIMGVDYIWQAIENPYVELLVQRAMQQSGIALAAKHNVPYIEINDHVLDLLNRFGNRQLGDTVKRVGNDLNRKLNPNDRIVGALNMCVAQGITPNYICLAAAAAMNFSHDEVSQKPAAEILAEICKIDAQSEAGKAILAYDKLIKDGATVEELLAQVRE
ncbi:MAG: mannitol dehydrogenase [Clostridia bacterium]|nr:mannitol dehydrogenase [Clostridia bacterium]